MINAIPHLKPGDSIGIVSPAKAIDPELIDYAKEFLESNGFTVRLGKRCRSRHNYFSGTIEERRTDFQEMLDDESLKAILCARGGYGSVQFIDQLNWSRFEKTPKWIIGFSDITIFHQRLYQMGYPSIHGTMPLNFKENSNESLQGLIETLKGTSISTTLPNNPYNQSGSSQGILIGGNLSILYSLIGTNDQVDYSNAILFIEDLCEPLYHLDRIFHSFRKAGILKKINGLVVGGMTDMKDTEIPFGMSVEEIILSHVAELQIPVMFNYPAGHIYDNRPLVFGVPAELSVNEKETTLRCLQD